jgi:hypothetical protein
MTDDDGGEGTSRRPGLAAKRETGATLVLASHNMSEVERVCDLVLMMRVLAPNAKLRPEIIPSFGRQAGNIPVPGFPSVPVKYPLSGITLRCPLPRRLPP